MYSVVLMTAITAGSATPDHWFRGLGGHGCHGCHACHGCNGCNGAGCYGYMAVNGNFCHGCYGGGCLGAQQGWYTSWYSGCYGCSGCYGNPIAGYTGYPGYPGYSAYPGYPNHWAYWPYGCYGCYGCYAGWSCYGAPLPGDGAPKDKGKEEDKKGKAGDGKDKTGAIDRRDDNRARVIVDLPDDARLYIDGQLMKATSARRVFQTPDLVAGQVYYYEIKAEVERDGRTITETRRILLQPGQISTASFASMPAPPATATASR